MPASTSSNTSVRAGSSRSSLSTSRRASIARASSPPEATLVSGCSGVPGLAAKQELDAVAGVVVVVLADLDADRGVRQRQLAQALRDGRGQLGRGARGGPRPTASAARRSAATASRRSSSSAAARSSNRLSSSSRAAARARRRRSPRRGRRRTCGAGRAAADGARARPPVARGPPRSPRRRRGPRRRRRRARRAATTRRSAASRNGRPTGHRGERRGDGVAGAAVVEQGIVGGGAGLAVADGVGQGVLGQLQADLLVGVVDRRGRQLVDLEPQQVDLPGPLALVAAERRQLGVELGQPGPRRPQRAEVDRRRSGRAPARWVGPASRLWWSCWPCRSTRPAAASASAPTVVGRPSM